MTQPADEASREEEFQDLLLRYSAELGEEDRKKVENRLWRKFGKTITTLVVDMSGFTKISQSHGIVHFLSMVRRMQLTIQPIVDTYNGTVIRFEADNAFSKFKSPGKAISACIALNLAMRSANLLTPEELDIEVSCGIDHGKCLIPKESDFWGVAVNRASKLGEDLGQPGQILVTEEAMALVPKSMDFESEILEVEVGGDVISVHSIKYGETASKK